MTAAAGLRVLLFAFDLDHQSGWGHLSLETARSLQERGHRVQVVVPRKARVEETPGVAVHRLLWAPRYGKTRLSWLPLRPVKLFRLVAGSQVVHCTVEPLSMLAVAAALGRRPVVQTGVGTFSIAPFRRPGWRSRLFARAWRRLAAVVAISRFTAARIQDFHPGVPVEVVRPGIRLPEAPRSGRARWSPVPRVLAVAAVKQRKGLQDLVRGFAAFRRERPGATLRIAGRIESEEEHRRLRDLVDENGLREAVSILGHVSAEELRRLYLESQVFALTPTSTRFNFEGFGLVYLEANAYGLPVVGTTGCGADDAIADGTSGLLVPQSAPQRIARALHRLTDDKEEWGRFSEGALEHARSLSWPAYGEGLEAVYRRLV